jgi:hypothetical protein
MMATLTMVRSIDSAGTARSAGAMPTSDASEMLRQRAARLRDDAATMHPLVASAYRRRAAELTVAAWVGAIRSGCGEPTTPAPLDAA